MRAVWIRVEQYNGQGCVCVRASGSHRAPFWQVRRVIQMFKSACHFLMFPLYWFRCFQPWLPLVTIIARPLVSERVWPQLRLVQQTNPEMNLECFECSVLFVLKPLSPFIFAPADEHDAVQKKTFTKWINSQFSKVCESYLHPFFSKNKLFLCVFAVIKWNYLRAISAKTNSSLWGFYPTAKPKTLGCLWANFFCVCGPDFRFHHSKIYAIR